MLAGLGFAPACLSYYVLNVSWYNKWGFHTRNDQPELHSDNFHADHHTFHNVNFGFTYPHELLMRTTMKSVGDQATWTVGDAKWLITRSQDDKTVKLSFKPESVTDDLRSSLSHSMGEVVTQGKPWFTGKPKPTHC